jgi:hypothetical protein
MAMLPLDRVEVVSLIVMTVAIAFCAYILLAVA